MNQKRKPDRVGYKPYQKACISVCDANETTAMKRFRKWLSALVFLIVWQLIAIQLNNEILLPAPTDVMLYMLHQMQTATFYHTVLVTVIRMLQGLSVAAVIGIAMGMLTARVSWIHDLFYPIEMAMKTIPNISYIIIALIWLGSERSVILVGFLVLFPIFFANTQHAMISLPMMYREAGQLYAPSWFKRMWQVELPLIRPMLYAAFQTAIGLGFKVCVMAEILGRVQNGIGFSIDFARVNLDMTGVFAWTVWIVLLSLGLDFIFRRNTNNQNGSANG